jgi:hypothetical protein
MLLKNFFNPMTVKGRNNFINFGINGPNGDTFDKEVF